MNLEITFQNEKKNSKPIGKHTTNIKSAEGSV